MPFLDGVEDVVKIAIEGDVQTLFDYLYRVEFFKEHSDPNQPELPDKKFNEAVMDILAFKYPEEFAKTTYSEEYLPGGEKFNEARDFLVAQIENKRNQIADNEKKGTPFQFEQIEGASRLEYIKLAANATNHAREEDNRGGGDCGAYAIIDGLRAGFPNGDGMPEEWPAEIKQLVAGTEPLSRKDAEKFRQAFVNYLATNNLYTAESRSELLGTRWLDDSDFKHIAQWLNIKITVVSVISDEKLGAPFSAENGGCCEIAILNQGISQESSSGLGYSNGYHFVALIPLKLREELAKKTTSTAKPEKPNEAEEAEQTNKAAPSNPTAEIIPFPKKEAKPNEEAKPEAAIVDNGTGKTHTAHVSGTDVASTVERKASVVPTELRQKETELPLRRISTPPSDTIFARHVQSISSDYSKDNVAANGFYAETTAASNIVWKDENQQQLATECATTTAVSRIELHMESNPVKAFEATLVSMNEMAQQVGGGEVTFTGITEDNYQQFIEAYNNFTERDASKYFKISFDSASQQVVNAHKPEFNALKLQECQEVMPHTQMHQQKLAQQAAEAAAKKVEPTPAAGVEATVTPGGDKPPKFKH